MSGRALAKIVWMYFEIGNLILFSSFRGQKMCVLLNGKSMKGMVQWNLDFREKLIKAFSARIKTKFIKYKNIVFFILS